MSMSIWPTFAERLLKGPYQCKATGILGFGGYSSINMVLHSVSKIRSHACTDEKAVNKTSPTNHTAKSSHHQNPELLKTMFLI